MGNHLLCEFSQEPDKWLLELIVGLGRDVIVLQVLLSVESNLLGLHFTIFDIDLVSDEGNWDVLADSNQIFVPLWNILVSDSGADIEHDDSAMATNVISVSESSEFLLTGGIPDVEKDLTLGGEEWHWMHLNTESSDVLLLELSSQMSLHESGFSNTTVSDENELEFRNWSLRFHFSTKKVWLFWLTLLTFFENIC